MFKAFLFFSIGIVIASCSYMIPTFNDENLKIVKTSFTDFTETDFKFARKAFIQKCSACHSLPNPKKFTKEKWLELLPEMLIDAKANEDEKILITKFIVSFAKDNALK